MEKFPNKNTNNKNEASSSLQRVAPKSTSASTVAEVDLNEYKAQLTRYSSKDKVLILALVDTSFLDMTYNFYETSISKFNITNYLLIASDHQACEKLAASNIHCYVYMTDKNAATATVYRSRAFNQKMNIRTFMILDALKLGFTVLHTDVDIVFLKEPLRDLSSSSGDADLSCLSDAGTCNAGFIYIKPTRFSIDVYTRMKEMALNTKLDDQTALNKALRSATKELGSSAGRKRMLDENEYESGQRYFEFGGRYFAESAPCTRCIVVHNNWIVSKEAKRYRFRELLLWSYDHDGYYTNTTTKYLMYSNTPLNNSNSSQFGIELDALKTALYFGHVLHRVVILPRFHLTTQKSSAKRTVERPLNNWIKIMSFDRYFFEKYRENAFLQHPKVPREIKRDITPPFWIKTNYSETLFPKQPPHVTVLTPSDGKKTTDEDLIKWFGNEQAAILNFHSLYGIFGADSTPKSAETFFNDVKFAFKRSDYRQLKN